MHVDGCVGEVFFGFFAFLGIWPFGGCPSPLAGALWCLAVKCKSDLVCGLINKFIISCHSCVRVRHACHVIAQPRACAILSAPLSEVMWLVAHNPHLPNGTLSESQEERLLVCMVHSL